MCERHWTASCQWSRSKTPNYRPVRVELREYQSRAATRLRESLRGGNRRIVLVSPTGSGKTVMASHLIRSAVERGNKAIFLAHRKELIDQASRKLDAMGVDHGVIRANHKRRRPWSEVQVASVQTLVRRPHVEARLVIVDECHRAKAGMYQRILERFKTPPIVIGLTATPYRFEQGQEKSLVPETFDTMVQCATARELVEQGFIVNPRHFCCAELDGSKLRVRKNGQYTEASQAEALRDVMVRGEIVQNWMDKAQGFATIVFAHSVDFSKKIARQYSDAGIKARHLDGSMSQSERDSILKQLAAREIDIVCNCDVLSEGYDLPLLECVQITRKIQTRGLYTQIVGRVMRASNEKRGAVVLDHGGNTRRHGFVVDARVSQSRAQPRGGKSYSGGVPTEQQPIACSECRSFYHPDHETCPHCGFPNPEWEFGETEEDLVEVFSDHVKPTEIEFEPPSQESRMQGYFNYVCRLCIEKQYKPGWASHKFKAKFKMWPNQAKVIKPDFFSQYSTDTKKTA